MDGAFPYPFRPCVMTTMLLAEKGCTGPPVSTTPKLTGGVAVELVVLRGTNMLLMQSFQIPQAQEATVSHRRHNFQLLGNPRIWVSKISASERCWINSSGEESSLFILRTAWSAAAKMFPTLPCQYGSTVA